jgi:hypothetical protein
VGTYEPDQIRIRYRSRPSETGIDLNHDFCYIPTEEELEEEFGPGLYNIFVREKDDTPFRLKKRCNIEGHPIIPVTDYGIKVRVTEGGKLLNTNVEFAGGRPPTKDDIITALGGGGYIKLNAKNKKGKIIWSEWMDYSDIEPPQELKCKDDTFKSKLERELEAQRKAIEGEALDAIKGQENPSSSNFDTAVNKLLEALEDKKLERLEAGINSLAEEIREPIGGGRSDDDKGLADLVFVEPYLMKLQVKREIIAELEKKDPEEAMRALEKMPDEITMGLKLAIAGIELVDALKDYLKVRITN